MLSEAEQSTEVTFVPTAVVAIRQEAPNSPASRVARLNTILDALGVSNTRASTQIYAHPEAIHLLGLHDLRFLVENAKLLVAKKEVQCDWQTFLGLLWSMLRDTAGQTDRFATAVRGEKSGLGAFVAGPHTARLATLPHFTSQQGATAPPTAADSVKVAPPSPNATELRRAALGLEPVLLRLLLLGRLLIACEAVSVKGSRGEAPPAAGRTPQDLELVLRVSERLARWLNELLGEGEGGFTASPPPTSSASDRRLLRCLAQTVGVFWGLLRPFAKDRALDVGAVLRVLNSETAWQASGWAPVTASAYTHALAAFLHALLSNRRGEFANAEGAAARLMWERVARRPKFHWGAFKLLYFDVQHFTTVRAHPDNAVFGQLVMITCAMNGIQECLGSDLALPSLDRAEGQRREAAVRQARESLTRHLEEVTETPSGPSLASYSQLLLLATLQGMQTVDFTNDDALLRRARLTGLTEDPAVCESPDALRLVLACAYQMPSPPGVLHDPLTEASILALQSSINRYVLQQPGFARAAEHPGGEGVEAVCGLFALPALEPERWCSLVLRSLAELPELGLPGRPSTPAEVPAQTTAVDATVGSTPSPAASTAPGVEDLARVRAAMLRVLREAVRVIYDANEAFYRTHGDALEGPASRRGGPSLGVVLETVQPQSLWEVTGVASELLFLYFAGEEVVQGMDPFAALEVLTRIYALRVSTPTRLEMGPGQRLDALGLARRLLRMQAGLTALAHRMTPAAVERWLTQRLVPLAADATAVDAARMRNRLRVGLLEAFLRALASPIAAFAVPDELLLKHWVDVALPGLRAGVGPIAAGLGLASAAHDFLTAAFTARKAVSALFVPTYVALFIPTTTAGTEPGKGLHRGRYGTPSLGLLRRFAVSVRAVCQGLESSDETELERVREAGAGAVGETLTTHADRLRRVTPINAVLFIVAALFDMLCILWNATPGFVTEAHKRFVIYFSALANLLQCANTQVLNRVCASLEAIMLEHVNDAGELQLQLLKYVSGVVDNVQGNSKKGVAEWYLKLNNKVLQNTKAVGSKL